VLKFHRQSMPGQRSWVVTEDWFAVMYYYNNWISQCNNYIEIKNQKQLSVIIVILNTNVFITRLVRLKLVRNTHES